MIAGAIIIGILSSFQAKEIFEFTPEEGISVFTIAYLQVLFIERIIELFSGANVFGNKEEIENAKAESAAATAEDIEFTKLHQEEDAKKKKKQAEKITKKGSYFFWGIASLLGMILVFFTLGLHETVVV